MKKKYLNKEIERIEYFIPKGYKGNAYGKKPITADEAFVLLSERGIKTPIEDIENPYRYRQLLEGKRWQGITCHELWEPGIIDGCGLGYWTLLGGEDPKEIMPRIIVDFMKGEMFKGKDSEIIEKCYQDVLKHWTWWRRLLFKLKYNLYKKI
jgi:hypothetical protein